MPDLPDMPDLLEYHGADWAGFALTLLSLVMLGNQRRGGFLAGALACCFWGLFSVMTGSVATLVANGTFFVLNLRGYVKWGREQKRTSPPEPAP